MTIELATPQNRIKYVLDTNVLLHDPQSLLSFQEHDVVLPMVVLEELDRHKKGTADTARNARQVARTVLLAMPFGDMSNGFSLGAVDARSSGRLFFYQPVGSATIGGLQPGKADNEILACAQELGGKGEPAVLVTKDINLRVKAMACGVTAQDYLTDRVELADEDLLPKGFAAVEEDIWIAADCEPYRKGAKTYAQLPWSLPLNSFLLEKQFNGKSRLWRVESSAQGQSLLYAVSGKSANGALLSAKNEQQTMALNLLNDESLDFVSLMGPAGTGKTLMAIAAGLEQVKVGRFEEVLITRATVPLGDDIGFLPGTEAEKMGAWLGGSLKDVFSVLQLPETSPLKSKVEIASMSFMRGRSFQGKYIIVDEAQNLTTKQVRALLTRAGEGSKVVLCGNLSQIDTPYLDEGSSGLAWAVHSLQNWRHAGHLILTVGERSRLATFIETLAA